MRRRSHEVARMFGGLMLGLLILRVPAMAQDPVGPPFESEGWLEPDPHPSLVSPATEGFPPAPAGDPLGPVPVHPRVVQVVGGVAGWFAGGVVTGLVAGVSTLCILSDDANSDACRDTRTASLIGAGVVSALMVEGLGRDRRETTAYTRVFATAAAGFGFAALLHAHSGDDEPMELDLTLLSLQVGGALLGDYWASRTQP